MFQMDIVTGISIMGCRPKLLEEYFPRPATSRAHVVADSDQLEAEFDKRTNRPCLHWPHQLKQQRICIRIHLDLKGFDPKSAARKAWPREILAYYLSRDALRSPWH
jgi:hypothetical protein